MTIEVKVPILPESVEDAIIATWHKQPGETVRRDENLVDLETDKVVLEVPAPIDGTLKEIKAAEGATVLSDELLAIIEEGAVAPVAEAEAEAVADTPGPAKAAAPSAAKAASAEPSKLSPAALDETDHIALGDPAAASCTGNTGRIHFFFFCHTTGGGTEF